MEKQKNMWLKQKPEEIEELILKLSTKMTPEKIGLFLRDNYGVPTTKIFKKKILAVLKKHNISFDQLTNLKNKSEKLIEHTKANKTDKCALRAFSINQAKIKKLSNYLSKD